MIKNKHKKPFQLSLFSVKILAIVFGIGFFSSMSVVNANTADIAKMFKSEQSLRAGEVVSINSDRGDFVERAVQGTEVSLLGVVVEPNDATLELGSDGADVAVAITGRALVNVNDSNGSIARGDLVGLSSEPGVGALALEGAPVVGVAEASLDASSGMIPIIVSAGIAPSGDNTSTATWIRSVAGNDVSALQIGFVVFIATVGLAAIGVLTYSAIRNGLVAVGRNPLARPAIFGALSQTMAMVGLIALSSGGLMYFILRL